jgi:hypothetical protein
MNKINAFKYEVRTGETITIKVTPTQFGASGFSVEATLDSHGIAPLPGTDNTPTYKFIVNRPTGQIHPVLMEFTFLAGSPGSAFYEVSISGENDSGCPCGFTVKQTTANKEPAIRFTVV